MSANSEGDARRGPRYAVDLKKLCEGTPATRSRIETGTWGDDHAGTGGDDQ